MSERERGQEREVKREREEQVCGRVKRRIIEVRSVEGGGREDTELLPAVHFIIVSVILQFPQLSHPFLSAGASCLSRTQSVLHLRWEEGLGDTAEDNIHSWLADIPVALGKERLGVDQGRRSSKAEL